MHGCRGMGYRRLNSRTIYTLHMTDVRSSPLFRASVLIRVAQKQLDCASFPKTELNHVLGAVDPPERIPRLDATQRDAVSSALSTISAADAASQKENTNSFEMMRLRFISCGCMLLLCDQRARSSLEKLAQQLRPSEQSNKEELILNAAVLGTLSWVCSSPIGDRYRRWRENTLRLLYHGTSPRSSPSAPREKDSF